MTTPAAVPVDGTRRTYFLEGDVTALGAITLAEITAGTAIHNYLTTDGFQNGGDQQSIPDGRHGTSRDYELPGRETDTLTLQYTYNLNEPADDEARLAMAKGTKGVIVELLQGEEDEPPAVGDFYEAYPVTCGKQILVQTATNALDRIQQRMFLRGPKAEFKQLVAA